MITIYNNTTKETISENFSHMLLMFDYLAGNEYGKEDDLDILADGKKIYEIKNWGNINDGIGFYMRKFWGIK